MSSSTEPKPLLKGTDRFIIEPHFKVSGRSDIRNVTGLSRDGWKLTDTYANAGHRFETKRDAVRYAERRLADDRLIDWARVSAWTCSFFSGFSGVLEVYVADEAGERVGYVGLVGRSVGDEDEGTRANIARLLELLGHPDISERS